MFGTANQPILKNQSQGFLATLYNPEKPLSVKISNSNLSVWHLLKDSTDDSRDSWQKKASIGSSFPDEVYYFHPIAFIEHLRKISKTKIVWPLRRNMIRKKMKNHTFGPVRKYPDGRVKNHQGWDFEASVGTEIYSIADGEVVDVFEDPSPDNFGFQIKISFDYNDKIYYAFYAHLKKIDVSIGEKVKAGDKIGQSGKSGNAATLRSPRDEHLHFEIHIESGRLGKGLAGRVSPLEIFGICPLYNAAM